MRREKGFTLIELMIVIAIIAIIAAIAIPGLLSAQRSANERSASASLKTLATAEIDFRSNDRDSNRVNDFWTVSVAGLFAIEPASDGTNYAAAIKLIDPSIAGADTLSTGDLDAQDGTGGTAPSNWAYRIATTTIPNRGAKAGYWYYALTSDLSEGAELLAVDTDGAPLSNLHHHAAKFSFGAFPDTFGVGRSVFMVNESATVIRYPLSTYVRPNLAQYPPGALTAAFQPTPAAPDLRNYPSDTVMSSFSRLD